MSQPTSAQLMRHVRQIVKASIGYRFGAETAAGDRGVMLDCSELVEQACAELDLDPRMPDGSWYQARHCAEHGTLISIPRALTTPGALLFRFSTGPGAVPENRPSGAHVAVSDGKGWTWEARSSTAGVRRFPGAAGGRWTHAALVPGVRYPRRKRDAAPTSIGRGDRSCWVSELQKALNAALQPLDVDGEAGPLTEARIRAWQAEHRRPVTGVADAAMLDALGIR